MKFVLQVLKTCMKIPSTVQRRYKSVSIIKMSVYKTAASLQVLKSMIYNWLNFWARYHLTSKTVSLQLATEKLAVCSPELVYMCLREKSLPLPGIKPCLQLHCIVQPKTGLLISHQTHCQCSWNHSSICHHLVSEIKIKIQLFWDKIGFEPQAKQ